MALDPRLDRADDLLRRHPAQFRPQTLGEYLGVARLAEHVAEPYELAAEPIRPGAVDDLPERPERAAEPAGGHPHLVHRAGLVQAHHRVERREPVDLCPQVGQHDMAGRCVRLRADDDQVRRPRA